MRGEERGRTIFIDFLDCGNRNTYAGRTRAEDDKREVVLVALRSAAPIRPRSDQVFRGAGDYAVLTWSFKKCRLLLAILTFFRACSTEIRLPR